MVYALSFNTRFGKLTTYCCTPGCCPSFRYNQSKLIFDSKKYTNEFMKIISSKDALSNCFQFNKNYLESANFEIIEE